MKNINGYHFQVKLPDTCQNYGRMKHVIEDVPVKINGSLFFKYVLYKLWYKIESRLKKAIEVMKDEIN